MKGEGFLLQSYQRFKQAPLVPIHATGPFEMVSIVPTRIHHDRGNEFNGKMFQHLHKLSGISLSNTTPLTLRRATSEPSMVGIGGLLAPPWYLRIGKSLGLPLWTISRPS